MAPTACSRGATAPDMQAARPLDPKIVPPTIVGMNVGVPAYWSAERAFSDQIKNVGDFSIAGQVPFGPGQLSAGGYPQKIARGTSLRLFVDASVTRRVGDYDCEVTPGWTVALLYPGDGGVLKGNREHFGLTIPPYAPGIQVAFQVTPSSDGLSLDKLSCMPRGAPPQRFNPAFIEDMKPFRVLRFMDWMHTNNQPPQQWRNRPLPTDLSPIQRGASVEDMVALANQTHSDPWFTLPMDADQDYYRNFATYVRDHLDKDRRAYVELSNEVWNPSFHQNKDAIERGKARYAGVSDQQAADYYYGDRVRELMTVWTEVFAGQTKRIVRVAATQADWVERSESLLGHNDTYKSVDALAIAPYFGTVIQDIQETGKPRVDKVLARLPGQAEQTLQRAVRTKAIANRFGVQLIAYEGGPDVVGFDPPATKDANAIIHDPRLFDIYRTFLEGWRSRVGGLLTLYDSTGASTYSHSDFTGQPLDQAPKMRAAAEFARAVNQPGGVARR